MLMTEHDARLVATWLRRLPGQICTPLGMPREYVQYVQNNGLARFHEWPSGHWQVTCAGWDFCWEHLETDA